LNVEPIAMLAVGSNEILIEVIAAAVARQRPTIAPTLSPASDERLKVVL
jgi:hypothetical protein